MWAIPLNVEKKSHAIISHGNYVHETILATGNLRIGGSGNLSADRNANESANLDILPNKV